MSLKKLGDNLRFVTYSGWVGLAKDKIQTEKDRSKYYGRN
jgi:hypothetical protein